MKRRLQLHRFRNAGMTKADPAVAAVLLKDKAWVRVQHVLLPRRRREKD
eukprot:CAMPEP_0118990394 /NCGR_PEP_ID=MMETSP1173-20130426/49821_1 /TAXON_ID=1034831 /ORGANISM="Rhizochromulina marina cf, Strain CCMP1243" /LENGTH=48 /DNA_ID= /DNA_START= /DNA_END= /DNA_ORIENTATION=